MAKGPENGSDLVAPPGFRLLSPEEELELERLAHQTSIAIHTRRLQSERIRAATAEIESASLSTEKIERELSFLRQRTKTVEKSLGIEHPHDRKEIQGKVYVRDRGQSDMIEVPGVEPAAAPAGAADAPEASR